MNRGFFVMFFMYFFVVQSAIFGVVRGEPKFYIIGIINLIFIILMASFYKNFDKTPSHEGKRDISETSKSEHIVHKYHAPLNVSKKNNGTALGYLFVISIVALFLVVLDKAFLNVLPLNIRWFAGFYFVMLFVSVKKLLDHKISIGDTVFLPKDFLFWTSLIVVLGVYGTLPLELLSFKLLFASCIGFIFFFIGARIVKEAGSSLFKLFFTRFYLVLMAVLVLILGVQSLFSTYATKLTADLNTVQSLFTNGFSFTRVQQIEDTFTGADILSNGTGQIISSSFVSTGSTSGTIESMYADTFPTGNVSSDVLPLSTGLVEDSTVTEIGPDIELAKDPRLEIATFPTLMDTLIYLMDHYTVTLSSQKNIAFTYVSPKNPYYPQFKTAYDMKLIGKTANPSKRVLCETYMVMKGLIEERTIAKTSDIKLAYRNEAKTRGVLNGCKRNFYVQNINL